MKNGDFPAHLENTGVGTVFCMELSKKCKEKMFPTQKLSGKGLAGGVWEIGLGI